MKNCNDFDIDTLAPSLISLNVFKNYDKNPLEIKWIFLVIFGGKIFNFTLDKQILLIKITDIPILYTPTLPYDTSRRFISLNLITFFEVKMVSRFFSLKLITFDEVKT